MSRLPKNELLAQKESSNGTYIIRVYRSDGGATTAYVILEELSFNKIKKKPKNI
jgi:hypothetical protein